MSQDNTMMEVVFYQRENVDSMRLDVNIHRYRLIDRVWKLVSTYMVIIKPIPVESFVFIRFLMLIQKY